MSLEVARDTIRSRAACVFYVDPNFACGTNNLRRRLVIYVNILLTVNDENDVEEIRGLLSEQGRLSREEPGCARFEVYHSESDPKMFLLCERWESQEAIDLHREARAYQEIYKPKVLPRVERVPIVSSLVE